MKFSDTVISLIVITLVAVGAYFVIENTMIQSEGESEGQVRVASPIDNIADKVAEEDPEVETLQQDTPVSEEPSPVEESRTDIQSKGASETETLQKDTPVSEEPSRLERGKEDGPISLDLLSS